MSVKIEILIPNDEIVDGKAALEKRMAVLGYTFGVAAVPVIRGEARAMPGAGLGDSDQQEREVERQPFQPYAGTAPEQAKEEPKPEPAKKRGRPAKAEPAPEAAKAEPTPNISAAPENRVDPEVEAQDAADEAAEVAAQPAKELTAEDLRAVMGRYVTAFGLAEAQADGPKLFADALGAPPDGAQIWSVTLASKSPDTLAKAVAAWEAAVNAGKRYGQ